jgi:hypothetical protein
MIIAPGDHLESPALRAQLTSAEAQKPTKQGADILTSIAGSKQRRDDFEVVVKQHIEDDLFAKVKFSYDEVDLAVGAKIHTDHKRKCKDQIGGQGLSMASHDLHMETVWTLAMTKHVQKNALAQKRSAGESNPTSVPTGHMTCH